MHEKVFNKQIFNENNMSLFTAVLYVTQAGSPKL